MPDLDTQVAAPAADTSAASTPSSSPESPVSAPASSPAAEPTPVTKNAGEDDADYLSRVIDSKAPADTPADDPVTAEAPVKDEAKPEDGAKPEDAPKDQPTDEPSDDALSLEPDEIFATSKLAAAIKAGEIQCKDKATENILFATARHAAKGQKALDLTGGDLEQLEHAVAQAGEFGELTKLFTGARDVESTRALLGKMREFSYVLDEDGNPVKDANGNIQTDGALDAFLGNIYQLGTTWHLDAMRKSGNPDYAAAADLMEQYLKSQSGSAPETPDYSQLDEATKARLEAADAREKEVAAREAAESDRKSREFELGVSSGIDTGVDKDIDTLLKPAALTEGQRKWAKEQIKTRAIEQVKGSRLFFTKLDALMRRPMGEKTMQMRVAHGLNSVRPLLRPIARAVIDELGVQISAKQQATSQKIAAQQVASRSEIKSTSKPVQPAKLSREDVMRNLQQKLGRTPSHEEYLMEIMG